MSASPLTSSSQAGWLREPLLHFALLGALLFALDSWLVTRRDDPHTIVLDQTVDDEARRVFTAGRGREPNAQELKALRQVWLDNEVLYREGLALQVDKGDPSIRERIIFKALSVVEAGVRVPEVGDQELRTWFEEHRSKYDEPARIDFDEAALSGAASEAAIRAFVTKLNGGMSGDAGAGLRVFKGRPHSNIEQSYGHDFAAALAGSAIGKWQALQGKDGWRAVRKTGSTNAHRADYEEIRGPVLQDWKDATAGEQRTTAVRALAKKYRVITATLGN